MTWRQILLSAAAIVIVLLAGRVAMRGIWRLLGAYRISKAGPRRLRATSHRLWREPGPIDALDPVHGPGSPDLAPHPPFEFIEEHSNGSQPCVSVRDGRGRRWRVKWGDEVRSETFAVRFAWACGYFAEVTYFVPAGAIASAANLARARACIDTTTGAFGDARFELDDPAVRKMFEEHSWSWDDNPFIGTREFTGLRILVMLLSNWDIKDRRDVARGSNTAIFEHRERRGRTEARYLLTDWGGSMGRWGASVATRGRWDLEGFEAQTPGFITGVDNGVVLFGYTGQRTAEIGGDIPVDHARWFYSYVKRLDERYLTTALTASGATDDEATRFARALTNRIEQLRAAVGPSGPIGEPPR
jgi:hypothetical protein